MTEPKPAIKMPELLVFARAFAVGFVAAEVFRVMFYLGENLANTAWWARVTLFLICLPLCFIYARERQAHLFAVRLRRSRRLDLLGAVVIGIWANGLAAPWVEDIHNVIRKSGPEWAPAVLALLCILLVSPLVAAYWPRMKVPPQLYFISDEEVKDPNQDLLENEAQAKSFAAVVLASGAHSGLVFGLDAPWGVGKTTFINLAQRHWELAGDEVVVCRFEPLRYASEPDLSERLIRDLSAVIQKKVFVPELRPAATRYSRLLKGKADFSFFGFKLSLEPSADTVDDLLEDIDGVLKQVGKRAIIVIDDLDRLDPKTVNNVLFATRRTFKISQATYVLCYDTEVLVGAKEDEQKKAREFLEKFVTVKMSLFVDGSSIRTFLTRDWEKIGNQHGAIPADSLMKLSAVMTELAEILGSEQAADYLPLVGNLRKVKRFVNAMLILQMEKLELEKTDFNKRDLIHLMLLHLTYPGVFREIYAKETEGLSGPFSVRRDPVKREFMNSSGFPKLLDDYKDASFLLRQLFDVGALGLNGFSSVDTGALVSRACFNQDPNRNLEKYLKLIVRFVTPEPRDTYVLYFNAVQKVIGGARIESVLNSDDFQLDRGDHAHDQFWSILVNQAHELTANVAEDAINTLVDYLPRYTSALQYDRGLRQRSIYTLLRLLDRAGWGRTSGRPHENSPKYVAEIGRRIFGELSINNGLIERLGNRDRGILGTYDLMLFRLQCSADRGGQLYNLHSALIVYWDLEAQTTGLVSNLALTGMRRLSQAVFANFKHEYIDTKRNFLAEVMTVSDDELLGESGDHFKQQWNDPVAVQKLVAGSRSSIKTFVVYQLSNRLPPTGSGVGCGFYDEEGEEDNSGIARLMNEYILDFCCNPEIDEDNIFHFLDHCLSNLSGPFFTDEEGHTPTVSSMPGGLDPEEMGRFWRIHGPLVRNRDPTQSDRRVITPSYTATYREDLPKVFGVLDQLAGPLRPEQDLKQN